MRQRKPKDLEERLELHASHLIRQPEKHRGKWNTFFGNENPIYIEIGCGKGRFITSLGEAHPEANFLGMEGQESVLLRGLEKIRHKELGNVFLIGTYLKDVRDWFAPGEVEGIYLNFSDPWPKDRHAKRRLTHRIFLEGYREVLSPTGHMEFKTDNTGLFDFTLAELEEEGFEILESSRDLHGSALAAKELKTEYEEKFSSQGMKINYVKWR